MRAIAARRRPGPVVVFVSAPSYRQDAPDWPQTLAWVATALPGGVVIDTFVDAFSGGCGQYRARWRDYAADLDGLVVFGTRITPCTYRLGPGARSELLTVIGAGRPVLVATSNVGLVPVVDCRPRRTGASDRPCLELTVPDRWSQSAPTVRAALRALTPAGSGGGAPSGPSPWDLNWRA